MPKVNPYAEPETIKTEPILVEESSPEPEEIKPEVKSKKPQKKLKRKHTKKTDLVKRKETNPDKFVFVGLDKKQYEITMKQKLFAELYLDPFIGSVEAVVQAGYDVYTDKGKVDRNMARVIAKENLMKLNVCQYITLIMEDTGLNDVVVDRALMFNIHQYDSLQAKNQAIEIYNKMKGRFAPEKVDVRQHHIFQDFTGWTPEEIKDYADTGTIPSRFRNA